MKIITRLHFQQRAWVMAALSAFICTFCVNTASAPFPDAHNMPPTGWTGPVFRLKQDYPATLPAAGSQPWKQFSFKTQPNEYLRAVLGYALEGNREVDF
jgi:hypothetical protein